MKWQPRPWMLAGVVLGGAMALAFLGPPGVLDEHGLPPAYWSSLLAPTVVACAPLVLARVRAFASEEA